MKFCENQIIKKLTWEKKADPPTGTNIHAKVHTRPHNTDHIFSEACFSPILWREWYKNNQYEIQNRSQFPPTSLRKLFH